MPVSLHGKRVRRPMKGVLSKYTIACICGTSFSGDLIKALLDEVHETIYEGNPAYDYVLGCLGGHNVVFMTLMELFEHYIDAGAELMADFPSVRFALSIGIGSAIPGSLDIRLGDVIVGQTTGGPGRKVHYGLDKAPKNQLHGLSPSVKPPMILLAAIAELNSNHQSRKNLISENLTQILKNDTRLRRNYTRPNTDEDLLFLASYQHTSGTDYDSCDRKQLISRPRRKEDRPRIHYGTIASGDMIMKNANRRDQLKTDMNVVCFAIEAAALSKFPSVMIRGICDYADSHQNTKWHAYATATAASYARGLLLTLSPNQLSKVPIASLIDSNHHQTLIPSYFGFMQYPVEAFAREPTVFVGRESELTQMKTMLHPPGTVGEQKRLILSGVAGVGKTRLCSQYVRIYAKYYNSVFWLNASSETTIKQDISDLSKSLRPQSFHESMLLRIQPWLSRIENTRWLLIFDNYGAYDAYDIESYFPPCSHGSIIITTRLSSPVQGEQMLLQPFENINDSLKLLGLTTEKSQIINGLDHEAHLLGHHLKGNPLAIVQVGTFLYNKGLTFKQYNDCYSRISSNPKEGFRLRDVTAYEISLSNVLSLMLKFLQEESLYVLRLLTILLYLQPGAISHRLLLAGVSDDYPQTYFIRDRLEYEKAARILAAYSILDFKSDSEVLHMHPTIHHWLATVTNQQPYVQYYWFAFRCVATTLRRIEPASFHFMDNYQFVHHATNFTQSTFCKVLEKIPENHVQDAIVIAKWLEKYNYLESSTILLEPVLVTLSRKTNDDDCRLLYTVAASLGQLYHNLAKFHQSREMFSRAQLGFRSMLGSRNIETLKALRGEGQAYMEEWLLKDAEEKLLLAMQGLEFNLGARHHETLLCARSLCSLYSKQGKLVQAQAILRDILFKENLEWPQGLFRLQTTNQLADIYYRRGKFTLAEEMYTKALSKHGSTLEFEYIETLNTMDGLGILFQGQGKLNEAEQMLLKVFAKRRAILGNDHPSTLTTMQNLGNLYAAQGRLNEASKMFTNVLERRKKVQGDSKFSSLALLRNIASVHLAMGEPVPAETILREALADSIIDKTHPLTLAMLDDLGRCCMRQGKLHEAEQLLAQSLSGLEKTLGSEHPSTLDVLSDTGMVYYLQGKFFAAEERFSRALVAQKNVLGDEHLNTLETMHNLGCLYIALGKHESATEKLLTALEKLKKGGYITHPLSLRSLVVVGSLYQTESQYSLAEATFRDLLNRLETQSMFGNTLAIDAIYGLSQAVHDQGRTDEAEQIYLQASALEAQQLKQTSVTT